MAERKLLPPLSAMRLSPATLPVPAVPRRRLPDAAVRLRALLRARWAAPFAWGTNDCCLLAADAVLAQTGVDPAAALRGRYTTAAGAGRLVRQCGGLQALATAALGMPLATPGHARLGDVGLSPAGTLYVCLGEHWAGPGPRGLLLQPLGAMAMAWGVGHG